MWKFLIKQAIEIAKFLNQKAIRLDVLCTNKPAIYLYENVVFITRISNNGLWGTCCCRTL